MAWGDVDDDQFTLESLERIILSNEDEHLDFKEAKRDFNIDKLVRYCAALANEGGGWLVLGVSDKKPRQIVGSQAFKDLQRIKTQVNDALNMRIDIHEMQHPKGRVLGIRIPSRPNGVPIAVAGTYWMRRGSDLVPMTPDMLKRIFAEAVPDFSAQPCSGATMDDVMPEAVEDFRNRWMRRSKNTALQTQSFESILEDAELIADGYLTHAALILFGTRKALGKYLAQAEIVFEFRTSEAAGPAQTRLELKQGFFTIYDRLWESINNRNDRQHYQSGLFMFEIPTFSESAVREALLNAVSHRDYQNPGSIFIRQFPKRIEIVSPGGFPTGITPRNILEKQSPRNRRLAEAFGKCGLVERAGQGMNRIFESCILEGKPLPDFVGTDEHQVSLTLYGNIQDARFLDFLEKVGQERLSTFATQDLLIMHLLYWGHPVPDNCKSRLPYLLELGIIEKHSRNKHILSRKFHAYIDKKGVYTRRRGLDRDQNRALLLKHIRDNVNEGSCMEEFRQILPGHSHNQIRSLLRDLQKQGQIRTTKRTRAARWYPSEESADLRPNPNKSQ